MHSLKVLLRYRLLALKNLLWSWRQQSLLKILVVSSLGTFFWASLFYLFYRMFGFVNEQAYIFRDQLVPGILSLLFLTLNLMLIFSTALISFSNLFKSEETAFLFSKPVPHESIYTYKLIESLVFSSWASIAFGFPLLLAYGLQSDVSWYFYPAILLFLFPFVMVPSTLGALLGLLLTAFTPRHRGKLLAGFLLLLFFMLSWLGLSIVEERGGLNARTNIDADLNLILSKLKFTQHVLTPNHWITQGLISVGQGPSHLLTAGLYLGGLCTSAIFFATLGWALSGLLYGGTYSTASAIQNRKVLIHFGFLDFVLKPFKRRWPAITVLVIKDLKAFIRDPVQWAQVVILFGLLLVYIAHIRKFDFPLGNIYYKNLILSLNLGATALTLATMVSRFVYPLISLEGRRFWILGLAPVSRKKVLLSKFIFSLVGTLMIAQILIVFSNYVLGSIFEIMIIQMLTGVLLCMGLTGLCVGMGALFPNLRETNPSKIISGFGGTLTLILSISMVIIVVGLQAIICHQILAIETPPVEGLTMPFESSDGPERSGSFLSLFAELHWSTIAFLTLMPVITLSATFIPMHLGGNALEKLEF